MPAAGATGRLSCGAGSPWGLGGQPAYGDQLDGHQYDVAAFILAAVLTPPDVVSQLMLAIPLLLLYEITIVAIWFTDRRQAAEEEAEQASA